MYSILLPRTSGYLLYPFVVRGSGYYLFVACASPDTLAIVKYVEIGTDSALLFQDPETFTLSQNKSKSSSAKIGYRKSGKVKPRRQSQANDN